MSSKKGSKKPKMAGTHVKFSFKKHLLPPLVGLLVAVMVFGFFNSQLLSGKIAYYFYSRHINAAALDEATAASPIDKNAPPKIVINKLNVKAPIVFDPAAVNEAAFQKDLRSGVVHYTNTASPGQRGNVVIFGHSSSQWWAPGDYKYIFTLLNKLAFGDLVFIDYQGQRYIYRVNNITVVKPTEVSVLNQGSSNALTLLTCSPVGSSANRLVVRAQQISPKPESGTNAKQPAQLPASASNVLPSNSSSFWHDFKDLVKSIF